MACKFLVHEAVGRHGHLLYSVKVEGHENEALLNLRGSGEQAKANAELVVAALNAYAENFVKATYKENENV